MERVRICVIGAGNFADYAYGPSLRLLAETDPNIVLAGVADIVPEKSRSFSERFGILHSYDDWRRMLAEEHPDGVIVLTPVAATAETACAVLAAGYPVMIEKPPGRCRSEIQRIMGASRQSRCPVMCAFNRRYSPFLMRAREILSGECGELPEHLRCAFCRFERLEHEFFTTAIHGIDAMRHLSGGRYAEVDFHYQEPRRERPVRKVLLYSRFDNGASGVIDFLPSTGAAVERYTIHTRHWMIEVHTVIPGGGGDVPGKITVYRDGRPLRVETPETAGFRMDTLYLAGYYPEIETFVRNLRCGFPAQSDLELSLDSVEIADALRRGDAKWRREAQEG